MKITVGQPLFLFPGSRGEVKDATILDPGQPFAAKVLYVHPMRPSQGAARVNLVAFDHVGKAVSITNCMVLNDGEVTEACHARVPNYNAAAQPLAQLDRPAPSAPVPINDMERMRSQIAPDGRYDNVTPPRTPSANRVLALYDAAKALLPLAENASDDHFGYGEYGKSAEFVAALDALSLALGGVERNSNSTDPHPLPMGRGANEGDTVFAASSDERRMQPPPQSPPDVEFHANGQVTFRIGPETHVETRHDALLYLHNRMNQEKKDGNVHLIPILQDVLAKVADGPTEPPRRIEFDMSTGKVSIRSPNSILTLEPQAALQHLAASGDFDGVKGLAEILNTIQNRAG